MKSCKYTLHYKLGEKYKALEYAKKRDDFDFICLVYESMNKPDSAKIYYYKQIDVLKSALKKEKESFKILLCERQIALLYTFIGDSINAKTYLTDLSHVDYATEQFMSRYDYYIENYISGGYNNFLHGETICMENDSISDSFIIDSLMKANRFYGGYSSTEHNNKVKEIYKFKVNFKEKAHAIGFKEVDCD